MIIIKDKIENVKEDFDSIRFYTNYFELSSKEGHQIIINCPNDLIETDTYNSFSLYLFKTPKYKANSSLFELKYNDSYCGFLFPINRLNEKEIEFTKFDENESRETNEIITEENNRILKQNNIYKFIAYYLLFNLEIVKEGLKYDYNYLITDLFDEENWILLIKNEILYKRDDNIYRFLPCLYRYGFLFECEKIISYFNNRKYEIIEDNELLLNEVCFNLNNLSYIKDLFEKYIIKEESCLARFLILYQVIEIYFGFWKKSETMSTIKKYNKNIIDFKRFKNLISSSATDIQILKKLFERNNTKYEYKELKSIVKNNSLNIQCDNIEHILYDIRNLVVHNYHFFSINNKNNYEDILIQINQEFENLIITLLLNQPINLEDQIREKAYFLSIDNPQNSPEENWFEAEKQILK